MDTLGQRIKEIRIEQALTQQQFADSICVSRPFISRVEADKEKPSDSLLKLISATYHVTFDWLKTGKGKKQGPIPYIEMQRQIGNSEILNLLLKDGNNKSYSFCLAVLMSILQNPRVKSGSRAYYIEQIKMMLASIDYYLKNLPEIYESDNYSILEKYELQNKLERELLSNIERYIGNAVRSKEEDDLDLLLDE